MKYDIATPYTASYVILRRDGKVAFVLRSGTDWMNGFYGLPAGKVEKGETYTAAALREAKEEVGVTIKPEALKHVLTLHRTHPDSTWVDSFFEATSWEGEPYNAEPDKHSELAWLDPLNLPDNVLDYLPDVLRRISDGETYYEHGWDNKS